LFDDEPQAATLRASAAAAAILREYAERNGTMVLTSGFRATR
jgi:hypothetical protein